MATRTRSCFRYDTGRLDEFVRATQVDPAKARSSVATHTEWVDAALIETRVGNNVIRTDEPAALGGTDIAAGPVELLLAALASCVSVGLVIQAAKRGVELRSLDIDVEGDLDLRGFFGDASVRPGFSDIRYRVRIESDASPDDLADILRGVERRSPMFDSIRNGTTISSRLEVVRT
jgi:uncharacterized OsmC-like protein